MTSTPSGRCSAARSTPTPGAAARAALTAQKISCRRCGHPRGGFTCPGTRRSRSARTGRSISSWCSRHCTRFPRVTRPRRTRAGASPPWRRSTRCSKKASGTSRGRKRGACSGS
uniref:Uncharacterized protein n=1 Tax=Arundo donax TaxID=35708 RepID=A0A0A8ZCT7_ARUDO